MTISRSHLVDEKAKNFFRSTLPDSWLKREQVPDHHIDYFVEIGEEGSIPSGITFGVQLKGTEKPRYSGHFISQRLDTECVRYYLENVQQPVFLVVVDVKRERAFWIFLQEWTIKELGDRNWRRQKTVTVRVPVANSLENMKRFRDAVIESVPFMRELRPGSIAASVRAEKKALEVLDDRFSVDISYQDGTIAYDARPREDVDITVTFKSEDLARLRTRLIDLVDRGLKAEFSPDEVDFRGSDLIRRIAEHPHVQRIELQTMRNREADLQLTSIDPSGKGLDRFSVRGRLSLGRKEAKLPRLPQQNTSSSTPSFSSSTARRNCLVDHNLGFRHFSLGGTAASKSALF